MENTQAMPAQLSVEKLTAANTITIEALIRLLESKGILSCEEIIELIDQIKSKQKPVVN